MPKTCRFQNCNYPIFSHGLCNRHQWARTDKELKRLKYRRKKTDVSLYGLFREIFDEREHVSFLSGRPLYANVDVSIWLCYFAHVLSRKMYPKFIIKKENIVLLTPEEHSLLDQGTEQKRKEYAEKYHCDWNKIYTLQDELKKEYETA